MNSSPFALEPNARESNWLGIPVGTLRLVDPAWLPEGAAIAAAAAESDYQMVVLAAATPVAIDGFIALGALAEYGASVQTVRDRLPVSRHFNTVSISQDHWSVLNDLLEYSAPTRFSRDPRIGPSLAKQRKLEILRERQQTSSGHGVLAFSSGGVCVGFQYSFVEDETYMLYELAVLAPGARGVVAAEMIAHNVAAAAERDLVFDRVSTLVYADNRAAIGFFAHIGLQPTGQQLWHYHLWI